VVVLAVFTVLSVAYRCLRAALLFSINLGSLDGGEPPMSQNSVRKHYVSV
jgi:hypothetical protein